MHIADQVVIKPNVSVRIHIMATHILSVESTSVWFMMTALTTWHVKMKNVLTHVIVQEMLTVVLRHTQSIVPAEMVMMEIPTNMDAPKYRT